MPKIPTYNSNPTLPQPIASGEAYGAAAARGKAAIGGALVDFGGSVSRAGNMLTERQTQREISQLNAAITQKQAELTIEWQETLRTADPNDTELASRFMKERVQNELGALSNTVKTREAREYFTRASAGLSAGFLTSTSAGQVNLAETAAISNFEQTLNNLTDATYADPLGFDANLQMLDVVADGFQRSGGLSTETRLKLVNDQKRSLARSAARGLIDQNPAAARQIIESGTYSEYITGEDKAALINYADSAIASKAAAEKQQRDAMDKEAQIDWMTKMSEGTYDFTQMVRDPRLDADSMRSLDAAARARANEGKEAGKKEQQDRNYQRDMKRALSGELTNTRAILDAVGRGEYTMERGRDLINVVAGDATPEGELRKAVTGDFERAASAAFIRENPMTGQTDPAGRARYTAFMAQTTRELQQRREKGQPGLEDPAVLQEFLRRIDQQKPTASQLLNERINLMQTEFSGTTKAPQYKSIDEYEKSKGKQ